MKYWSHLTACLCLSSISLGNETIFVRSGSFANAPAAPGMQIDNGACIATAVAGIPLSNSAFGPEFTAACAGSAPYVITPASPWLQSLPCDPEARWINSDLMFGTYGDPRSVLYCFPFTIESDAICSARIRMCWAVDDYLGDVSGPNPIGVYVNGTPLSNAFKGPGYSLQSSAAQTITALVSPGINHLYVYQGDVGASVSGVIFSAKIEVFAPPPCTPGFNDVIVELASGQNQGAPQVVGGLVDNAVALGSGSSTIPYQATLFTVGDLAAPCQTGGAPVAIQPHSAWLQSLACNPQARWINTAATSGYGIPAESALYCIPFTIPPQAFCKVQLDFCWAADDYFGDFSGPNPIGAYLNGVPLSAAFSGGSYASESTASMDVTSLMSSGLNHLVLYQRDAGATVSGIIYNAKFTLTPQSICNPPVIGVPYCDPAVANSTGTSALINALGSTFVSDADFYLEALQLPPNQFGMFIASRNQAFIVGPGGSQGNLCLGSGLARFNSQIQNSGPGGWISIFVDLGDIPTNPHVPVLAGETWNFQTWYRDLNPGPVSNFSSALSVTFD